MSGEALCVIFILYSFMKVKEIRVSYEYNISRKGMSLERNEKKKLKIKK
jgi:hypothetical protein